MPFPLIPVLGGAAAALALKFMIDRSKGPAFTNVADANSLEPGRPYAIRWTSNPAFGVTDPNVYWVNMKNQFNTSGWTTLADPSPSPANALQELDNFAKGKPSNWVIMAARWNGPGFNMTSPLAGILPGKIAFTPIPAAL